jgi:hypothetical protein
MADPFFFERDSRRPASLAIVGLGIAVLLGLILVIPTHPMIVTVFALVLAPAIWEVIKGRTHWLKLDSGAISWSIGGVETRVPWSEVEEVRVRTALDMSQRATLHLKSSDRLKVPMPCVPPGRRLENELKARDVPVTRVFFGL